MGECGFCHGKPVGNAARWIAANEPRYAPCPRCGETNLAPGGSPTPAGAPVDRTEDTAAVSEAGAETPCDCPPGWKHRPDCHHVT